MDDLITVFQSLTSLIFGTPASAVSVATPIQVNDSVVIHGTFADYYGEVLEVYANCARVRCYDDVLDGGTWREQSYAFALIEKAV